ncbi:hypothetical protein [Halorubrum sp. AJ67]|uniref:DUF7837 family putative zinc-binding protein n=1 Tax=Halorubrum sp. AJ67 TaxID=1173487 RepID=UPI0018969EBB|nr:hypothetical protein [Halorubrum sp. AJ67]
MREQSWLDYDDRTRSKIVSHAPSPPKRGMTSNNPEAVRGTCSFCGERVTGRHAIIHYETAGGEPGMWAECPGCGEIVDPINAQ